jgi:hypothetical protein
MPIREYIRKSPRIVFIAAGCLVVGSTMLIGRELRQMLHPHYLIAPGEAFFTSDDGATWFALSASNIAPVEVDGKEAVRAHVFEAGSRQWVQYLEKYNPKAKKELELMRAGSPPSVVTGDGLMRGPLVKKPGGTAWVRESDPSARDITTPKVPGGDPSDSPKEVMPTQP